MNKRALLRVLNRAPANVGSSARVMLHALWLHADDNGHACPTVDTIARACDTTPRTVYRALVRLEEARLVRVLRASGYRNVYVLVGWQPDGAPLDEPVTEHANVVLLDTRRNATGAANNVG